MKGLRLALLLVFIGVSGLSCGGLFGQRNAETIQNYMFSPREFQALGDTQSNVVLLISPMQSIGYDSRQMTYTMRPYERTYYAYSRWADTPPRMIEPLVVQAMEASGYFGAVVDVASSVVAQVRLELDLLVLDHEYQTTPSQGRIVIRAQLHDLEYNRIIGTAIFQERVAAPTENPYGGALALNLALEVVLSDILQWVGDSIPQKLEPLQLREEPPVE
ncbi:MAG: cholesterol transport system auxiliary component [Bradymonadia bacterium]|jgi:cholesterol transport system auxiliary component